MDNPQDKNTIDFTDYFSLVSDYQDNNAQLFIFYTPNANMADHSVVARDELHESEASQSLMFCFDNVSPGNSCFVVDLFCFNSLCLRVAVFLNATRRDRNLPPFHL